MTSLAEDQNSNYIHGSSPEEQERLSLLNDILNQKCLLELNPDPGSRILDVGCGLGQFSRVIANAAGSGGYALGIERDQQQVKEARKLAEDNEEQDLVEFRLGDALELPLKDSEWGTFDLAHCRFLLEHLPNPLTAVRQMMKAVRPGGRVFVIDDDHEYFHPWPEPEGFLPLWQAYVRSYEHLGNDPYIGRQLVLLLREAGLKSIRNSCVFFGGCAGNESFESVTDNLVGIMAGAKQSIISGGLLDEESYRVAINGLLKWKRNPESALWYSLCCAEGVFSPDG